MMAQNKQPTSRSIRLALWNADGILEQRMTSQHFLREFDIDIMLVNETHLHPPVKFAIRNYQILRTDRLGPKGGTAIFSKRHLPIQQITLPILQSLEATGAQLLTPGTPIILIAAYKQPNKLLNIDDLRALSRLGPRVLIGGDLNSKHQFWNSQFPNRAGGVLYQALPTLDFTPIAPPDPTCFPKNGGRPDVLDMVLYKGIHVVDGPFTIHALDSDHIPVRLDILQQHNLPSPHLPTVYSTDWEEYKCIVSANTDLRIKLQTTQDIDRAVQNLTADLQSALRITTTASISPNITHTPSPEQLRTQALISLKRWARKRWQITREPYWKTVWNALCKRVKQRILRLQVQHWDSRLQQLNKPTYEFWKLAKTFTNPRSVTASKPLHGPRGLVYSSTDKANLFSEVMEQQFMLNPEPYNEATIRLVNHCLQHTNLDEAFDPAYLTTPREVQHTIKRLRGRSAAGPDKIPTLALKHAPRKLLVLLTRLFNAMLLHSYFPSVWKTAKIIMIPKTGKDHLFPDNHRPISLLPTLSKIYERLIHRRLYHQVDVLNLLPHHQYGFRPGYDTVAQLVRVTEEITFQYNSFGHSFGVFLDSSKAFDRVWHDGLLYKLIQFAFPVYFVKLIQNYLTDRSFFVFCNGTSSILRPITAGVPQGSVLGPLLFNLYTADIPTSQHTKLATFADDTAIFSSHHNHRYAHLHAQRHLNLIEQWTTNWRIKTNLEKTCVVHFTRRRPAALRPLTFFGDPLQLQDSAKYLGIELDRKLTFRTHLITVAKRALQRTLALYPMLKSPVLSMDTRLHIYYMMIRPVLTYAAPAWRHAAPTYIKRLQIVQNRAAKIISGHSRDTRTVQLHEDLNLKLIDEFLDCLCRSFWNRIRNSPHASLQSIGTRDPPRRIYRMPHLI